MRKLTIWVNSSSVRREMFDKYQEVLPGKKPLRLIQDVATRWNSTFLMLVRALRLRSAIESYTEVIAHAQKFRLTNQEWNQCGIIVDITRLFNFMTESVGQNNSTASYILPIYEELLEHLEESSRRLSARTEPWAQTLQEGIRKAMDKLFEYYRKIFLQDNSLCVFATILNPAFKLSCFKEQYSWVTYTNTNWAVAFRDQFTTYFQEYYEDPTSLRSLRSSQPNLRGMTLFFNAARRNGASGSSQNLSEVDRYLQTSMCPILIFILITDFSSYYSGFTSRTLEAK